MWHVFKLCTPGTQHRASRALGGKAGEAAAPCRGQTPLPGKIRPLSQLHTTYWKMIGCKWQRSPEKEVIHSPFPGEGLIPLEIDIYSLVLKNISLSTITSQNYTRVSIFKAPVVGILQKEPLPHKPLSMGPAVTAPDTDFHTNYQKQRCRIPNTDALRRQYIFLVYASDHN